MEKELLEEIKTISLKRLEGLLSFWLSFEEPDDVQQAFVVWLINEKQRRMELWN